MDEIDYEQVVALYYEDLYRFALSLGGNSDDASELTQEAYCRLLTHGAQLRDPSKVKSWLMTTLYRTFLGRRRHASRFPHFTLASVEAELPVLTPEMVNVLDSALMMDALQQIDEHHRTPLVMFYLQDLSYREIAEVLEIPIGTVMSRLARGKDVLRERLASGSLDGQRSNIIPLDVCQQRKPE